MGPVDLPTCSLDPMPLEEVLPAMEIMWGGLNKNSANEVAAGLRQVDGEKLTGDAFKTSPWPAFGQVVQAPLVANLNDDNGDGKIDNHDVPEIIFTSFENSDHTSSDGVLRAISGGGKDADGNRRKGRDLLAVCGEYRYYDGVYYDEDGKETSKAPECDSDTPSLDSTATLAVGDLDYDGIPEIVAIGESESASTGFSVGKTTGSILIYSNTGKLLTRTPHMDFAFDSGGTFDSPAPSIANVVLADNAADELAEIVVGRNLISLDKDKDGKLSVKSIQYGLDANGSNSFYILDGFGGGTTVFQHGPVSCVADLIAGRPGMEIIAGGTVYGVPLSGDKYDASAENLETLATTGKDGFCGIADVWGAAANMPPGLENPLDGVPEIVLISDGTLGIYRLTSEDVLAEEAEDELPQTLVPADTEEDTETANADDTSADGTDGSTDTTDTDSLTDTENITDTVDTDTTEVETGPVDTGEPTYVTVYKLELLKEVDLPQADGVGGGAPNIDDFDGDGLPEIGTASSAGYVVFDLQAPVDECPAWDSFDDNQFTAARIPPNKACVTDEDCEDTTKFACGAGDTLTEGRCICLHNGWMVQTQDGSSKVTGSSVFDFNGDGAAEVIYNDECHFRLYDGLDGTEYMVEPSESRTRIEYPIVADVDNDGNAEIIFSTSNESGYCNLPDNSADCEEDADCPSGDNPNGQKCIDGKCLMADEDVFNNGIEVWGDPQDTWVTARRIWNEHAYHVTNVTESGGIPIVEKSNWAVGDTNLYNTYRSQPRTFGRAPDLTVTAVELSSPDASCGTLSQKLDISIEVTNIGDLRGGDGAQIVVQGRWGTETVFLKDSEGKLLSYKMENALLASQVLMVSLSYDIANNNKDKLPNEVNVIVDPPSNVLDEGNMTAVHGVERECNEDNNMFERLVDPGERSADLLIDITSASSDPCPPKITGVVSNIGTLDAKDVDILFYLGNPAQGGKPVLTHRIDKVAAGGSADYSVEIPDFPETVLIQVYAIVDPDNAISECNNANNQAGPTGDLHCGVTVE